MALGRQVPGWDLLPSLFLSVPLTPGSRAPGNWGWTASKQTVQQGCLWPAALEGAFPRHRHAPSLRDGPGFGPCAPAPHLPQLRFPSHSQLNWGSRPVSRIDLAASPSCSEAAESPAPGAADLFLRTGAGLPLQPLSFRAVGS